MLSIATQQGNSLTVAEGGSNDIYDVVSSKARGRSVVDLRELFAMY